jgi:hypothetical protein
MPTTLRFEQIITDVAWLMDNINRDREEKRNLFQDLSRVESVNPWCIFEFDKILLYDGRFLKKKFIK